VWWGVPFLLGSILLFSAWVSFPSDNNYFFTDSNGVRHYILTPEISDYDNAIDNLTNVLFIKYENPWAAYADTTMTDYSSNLETVQDPLSNAYQPDKQLAPSADQSPVPTQFFPDFTLVLEKNGDMLFEEQSVFTTEAIDYLNSFIDTKNNPTFLLLLLPLVGFILIRSEEEKLGARNFNQIMSFGFAAILLSSGFTLPMSLSYSYWGYAYGEEIPTNTTSVPSVEPINATTEPINATTAEPINATAEPINATTEPVNATTAEIPVNATSTEPITNATSAEIPVNATSTEPITNATSAEIPVNATSTEPITNATSAEIPVNATCWRYQSMPPLRNQ